MAKYLNINGKVCLDSWRSMLTVVMLPQSLHRAPFGAHASSVRSTRVLRSEHTRLPFGARDMDDRSDRISYTVHIHMG